ncbi:uncharacterized protein LOC129963527 isoform X2 [Argiope bruennichi]|uniref:Uncharacterized protein n=2 Tax=Argiope bruennichi TaxID=94029 RepID=A0A8T0EWW4_ARGBR|nr:uncharacterized protein LOC129963527 isoform X2 [Argiope bruennichi]KAF8782184.1 hypothetical protein HNY73_012506 [Argiope bruennichi]
MARNHEKHYGKLNRLILWKEKEEYEKKHPPRPRLDILDTPEEIKKWLPSIKADLEFYLKKSQVTCYSDEHIEECKVKVNNLEKEYKSFVRKIAKLTPGKLNAVPWTNRPYKRKNDDIAEDQSSKKEFVPISTPILDQEKELVQETTLPLPNLPLMNEPLVFAFDKETNSVQTNSQTVKCTDFETNATDTDKNYTPKKVTCTNYVETKNDVAIVHQKMNASNLVNYDYSSDSDS